MNKIKKYLGIFIAVFLITAIGYSIYEQMNKEPMSAKSKRIPCQKKTTTFEKIIKPQFVLEAQKLLKDGQYTLESSMKKSVYAKSKLFDYISLNQIDQMTIDTINKNIIQENNNDNRLFIKYYIYENDIKDPGKKTKKSKLYAGYLVYEFILNKKLVYKIQTDFMDFQGKDISNRIDCVFKSFLTIR